MAERSSIVECIIERAQRENAAAVLEEMLQGRVKMDALHELEQSGGSALASIIYYVRIRCLREVKTLDESGKDVPIQVPESKAGMVRQIILFLRSDCPYQWPIVHEPARVIGTSLIGGCLAIVATVLGLVAGLIAGAIWGWMWLLYLAGIPAGAAVVLLTVWFVCEKWWARRQDTAWREFGDLATYPFRTRREIDDARRRVAVRQPPGPP